MPQPTLKIFGLLGFSVVFAALPILLACSAESDEGANGGDAGVETGAVADGSFADAAPAEDTFPPEPTTPEVEELWLGEARGSEAADAFNGATSCFDGIDNDAADNATEDGVDCSDPECQALPSCCANDAACVGSSTMVVNEDFEACANAICVENFTIFGGPSDPVVDSGSLALQGDSFYDTGLYGGEELNLRDQRIDIQVEFRLGECAGCVETAAVALTAQETPTDNTFVRPLVGLRALSTVNEVQLIIHDRVVATYPAGEPGIAWNLSVRPDGQVSLDHGGTPVYKNFVPVVGAHIVLYGHSTNPGVDRVGARIERVSVERYATDRVDAWSPTRSLDLPGGRVSVARLGGVDYLAISDAITGDADDVRFHLASDGTVLNWLFQSDWDARDYSVAEIEGVIYVYAIDQEENLVRGAVDLALSDVSAPERVLDPSELGWNSVENPVVIEAAGNLILVAEVDGALGAAYLAETGWTALSSLPPLTRGAREPSLVTHHNVYWLHYSVQNGTRQRVRAMVSDQMVHWRDLGDALVGSGERESVDRFSVASPALVSDGDSLRMYVSADDHIVRRLAVVERTSPAGRTR
jgi:hypothetical protein